MKNLAITCLLISALLILAMAEPALAGPGGKIARAAFETFWGKVALVLLTILFFPLICYIMLKEKIAERRARRDLAYMAKHSSRFDWLKIQERVKDCFYRVHSGWEKEDLSEVTSWMTDWYWQNQQQVHLERWKKEGLVNICEVKRITRIKPLLFVHRNQGTEHEDSMVVVSVEADMKDFLQERKSGKVVEGSKNFKNVETLWSLTMENGQWKVSDIEEGAMSLSYVNAAKQLPKIETTVVSDLRA